MQVIELRNTDKIIVELTYKITTEQGERIQQHFSMLFPSNKVIIADGETKLTIARQGV